MNRVFVIAILFALSGCVTQFHGDAHIPNGRAGCESICRRWHLEFSGMVAMGEYSDACICSVEGKTALMDSAGPVSGAAVGVAMQMRNQQSAAASTR